MKVSHVLYKVNNLKNSVNKFRKKGFKVEYGSKNRPQNALIYFSEGPYIELLNKAPISTFIKLILRLWGKGKVVDRFERWEKEKEGFFEICFENYETDFRREENILKEYGITYFKTKSKRIDPLNRVLKWKLLFPYNLRLPFLMTYFNTDPKPKNFIHPNGIKKIRHISFGTDENLIPVIRELCKDEILELIVGNGIQKLIYEKVS